MQLGVIHVHSTHSDGEYSLPELRDVLVALGCSFVCMTDHAEAFDEAKLESYLQECASLSDERFLFLPGLEYECEARLHILGYGVTSLLGTKDPALVIDRINQRGGISVIAHPQDRAFQWIESVGGHAKGIEVWNTKYDGRYAPRLSTFALLKRLQGGATPIRAYYGLDLHWKKQFRSLFNRVNCGEHTRESILSALASGRYTAIKDKVELPASGRLPEPLLVQFGAMHARSTRFRRFARACKHALDRTGVRLPASIKSQLRRFF